MSAARVAGVALLALVAAGVSSCKRAEPAPPVVPWSIQVVTARGPEGGGDAAIVRCKPDGQECAPVHAKDPLPAASVFRIAQGGAATLSFDGTVTASFAPDTEVALADAPERVVSLRRGAFVLTFEPGGGSGTAPGDAGAATTLPSVRFPGGSLSLPSLRSTALSIAVQAVGNALVTVHHGIARMIASGSPPIEVLTGQTVRVSPDGAVDRRAGFRGELAFAEVTQADRGGADVPRGLGSMTARVPGTDRVVGGVRLSSHQVKAFVRDGFARTEVEEVFQNDTDQVLEGRYVFPLPPDASISRLGLWVDGRLVEGEMVESKRAAAIFQSIVDDTVRPRDPALLEWVKGSEFSLKVFPLPAHGKRQVVLAYNQVLPVAGGRVRYVYPLSLGKDRATRIDDLGIQVTVSNTTLVPHDPVTPNYAPALTTTGTALSAQYSAQKVAPDADFVLAYRQDTPEDRFAAAAYLPELGEFKASPAAGVGQAPPGDGRYVALRLRADLPADAQVPAGGLRDRAIVIDVSQSQSAETVAAAAGLVKAILTDLDADERFVLLACDSACTSFPAAGLAKAGEQSFVEVLQWLQKLSPGGASDVAGALLQAAQRLSPRAEGAAGDPQIVYLGDGAATAGELKPETMAARLAPVLGPLGADLRLLGAGRSVDEVALTALAQALGGTYERVATGEPIPQRASALSLSLRSPVVVSPKVEIPPGLGEVFPKSLPNVRVGQEIIVLGKASGTEPISLKLTGRLKDKPYVLASTFTLPGAATGQNPLVPRLWAEQRIRDLEASAAKDAQKQVIDLSHRFHVMSRYTSLLVLENERMFAEFGIERTTRVASDQSDEGFAAAGGGGPLRAGGGGGTSAPAAKAADIGGGSSGLRAMTPAAPPPPAAAAPAPAPARPSPVAPPTAPPHHGGPSGCAPGDLMCMMQMSRGDSDFRGRRMYSPPPPRLPSATVTRGDDAWTTQGQPEIDKLQEELVKAPTSRRKLEALVRGLLGKGRFADALPAARRFVELDPDLPLALELLSFAAVLAEDGPLALSTVDALCETSPQSARAHLRAAKAFEGAGNETRACGHWRALAEIEPGNEGYRYESLRCRARALAQPAPVLDELRGMAKRSKRLDELLRSIEAGTLPAYSAEPDTPGAVEVTVACEGGPGACPVPVVITPLGTVYSPWTPGDARTSQRGVAFSRVTSGAYRVLLVGGAAEAHGEVNVRALNGTLKVPFAKGGRQTIAIAQVTL
jgi:hypothetical protein